MTIVELMKAKFMQQLEAKVQECIEQRFTGSFEVVWEFGQPELVVRKKEEAA